MTILLDICPVPIDICISRGDTTPFTFTITSAGAAVDITGFSYTLTVDTLENPTDAATNVFALTGTITGATTGIVEFEMSAAQADQSAIVHYYDLEQTDANLKLRTIAKGEFEFKQDITKT